MNFSELVKTRESIRKYLDKPVEREKIERCLEAARLAPSAHNSQPWEFIVVEEPLLREKVAKATFTELVRFNRFALNAPVLVVMLSWIPSLSVLTGSALKKRRFNLIDTGICAEHFCLQAAEEGLGSCILGWFDARKIGKLLNISFPKKPVLVITLGYSAHSAIREKKRKNMDSLRKYLS